MYEGVPTSISRKDQKLEQQTGVPFGSSLEVLRLKVIILNLSLQYSGKSTNTLVTYGNVPSELLLMRVFVISLGLNETRPNLPNVGVSRPNVRAHDVMALRWNFAFSSLSI